MVDFAAIGTDFIAQYGLLAIFILLVLDGALLLPVFPGEIVLIMAITTYGTDPSGLLMLIALTSAAGLAGSILLYGITRIGGRRLVTRFPRFFMMPTRRRERLEKVFTHPAGQSLVLFLRLFPLTRVLVNIPAGLAKMPFVRFIVLSSIGLLTYHAAFLWFAYEVRRPGSEVEQQADQLRNAYADPAMDFVTANAVFSGVALLLVGMVISIRASRQMLQDPDESAGSLLGTLTIAVLFWGGLALGVATYLDPETVYSVMEAGGMEQESLGPSPALMLAGLAVTSVALGIMLGRLRGIARRHRRRHRKRKKMGRKRRKWAKKNPPTVGPVVPLAGRDEAASPTAQIDHAVGSRPETNAADEPTK